jgi:hypothetical protein
MREGFTFYSKLKAALYQLKTKLENDFPKYGLIHALVNLMVLKPGDRMHKLQTSAGDHLLH